MTLRIPTTLILLTALCGAVSVAVAALPVVSRYSAADQVFTAAARPVQAQENLRLDLSPILDFAPFGRAAAPQPTASAAPSALTLQGVSVSLDVKASRAIIAGGIGASSSYSTGEEIALGMTLTEIAADHVMLTSAAGPQRLDFPGITTTEQAEDTPGFSTGLQNLIPASQPLSPTMKTLRDQLQLNPQSVLSDYDITATLDGYLIGEETPFTEIGLQPGDLITQINGHRVGDIASDRSFLDEVAASGQATLLTQRSGQTLTLQVTLP